MAVIAGVLGYGKSAETPLYTFFDIMKKGNLNVGKAALRKVIKSFLEVIGFQTYPIRN